MRKPKGVGCELKSAADVDTGILIKLEIVEGKDPMSSKEFVAEFGPSTAMTLRLVKDLFGTGRTICADSAFASVKTATALLNRGLYFMGVVKTAHRCFPKKYMSNWSSQPQVAKGSHLTLKSKVVTAGGDTVPIFAVCWKDFKPKTFIFSRGTTTPGTPITRTRYKKVQQGLSYEDQTYEVVTPIPNCAAEYFKAFPIIDIHDHYRQGSLALESSWKTQTWWHRLFSTLFGMIVTDAFLGMRYERSNLHADAGVSNMTLKSFISKLILQLTSRVDGIEARVTRTRPLPPEHGNVSISTVIQISKICKNFQFF
jgi:hypothetical protein